MHEVELVVSLMIAVGVLAWIAEQINIPYPMLLVVGGLALALVPGVPEVELESELVLSLFLPPILFQAAFATSWRDFRAAAKPIMRLAFGLVLATTSLVAVVAHGVIPDLTWPAAFVLGAVVSPPDAVAATAIFQRLGAPHRIVTILEGESLVNDASAIVIYRFAVAAVVTGAFSFGDALVTFVVVVCVGVGAGVFFGWLLTALIPRLHDDLLETIATLIVPLLTYTVAEQLGGSGVLAVVAAGLVFGRSSSRVQSPTSRLRTVAVWDLVILAINGLIFILIGFELAVLRERIGSGEVWTLLWHSLAIAAAMVLARFGSVYGSFLVQSKRGRDVLDWRHQFVLAWSGLRGVVSLATALALPMVTDSGGSFDHRDEIILITAFVIVFTLIGLGLPLPWLLRKLHLADDGQVEREVAIAKKAVMRATLDAFARIAEDHPDLAAQFEPMRKRFESKFQESRTGVQEAGDSPLAGMYAPIARARMEGLAAARETLLALRDSGEIGDEARRRVERQLDFQELQMSS